MGERRVGKPQGGPGERFRKSPRGLGERRLVGWSGEARVRTVRRGFKRLGKPNLFSPRPVVNV